MLYNRYGCENECTRGNKCGCDKDYDREAECRCELERERREKREAARIIKASICELEKALAKLNCN